MQEIASDQVLEQAYTWLCERRRDYSYNDDVWEVRFRWTEIRTTMRADLLGGRYRFSPLRRIHRADDAVEIWSALDALVLKAMAIVLAKHLAPHLSSRCFHLRGNGGAKAAVRKVSQNLPASTFVFRTDVKSYYASIQHGILFSQLQQHLADRRLLDLLWQYMHRTIYDDGLYEDIGNGISLGCPLSPLMGALYLKPLDDAVADSGLFYGRFMNDWVILAASRWKLRKAIRRVNVILAELKVQQHPEKTFIGRISRGFDFLGYAFCSVGLKRIARKTVEKFAERAIRLYEQGADEVRIGAYVRRWRQWATTCLGQSACRAIIDSADAAIEKLKTPPLPQSLTRR